MIIALIVIIMFWYSFKWRFNSKKRYNKELEDHGKIEVRYTESTLQKKIYERTVAYTDFVDETSTVNAYKHLVYEYETGRISSSEFRERTSTLTERIRITDIESKAGY